MKPIAVPIRTGPSTTSVAVTTKSTGLAKPIVSQTQPCQRPRRRTLAPTCSARSSAAAGSKLPTSWRTPVISDPIRVCELIVGLPDVNVLGVEDLGADAPLRLHIESRGPRPVCEECGAAA